MRMNVFEIMLSIRLYQRFLIFVIPFDCDTMITESFFFVLILLCGLFSDNVGNNILVK